MKHDIEITIKIPNQTSYIRLVGNIAETMARDICQIPENRETFAFSMNVAMTEAITNAMKHANAADPDKEVRISITATKDEIDIKVYDCGQGFDINSIPCPNLDSNCLNETGRGMFIIRALMDSVAYGKTNGGNTLTMKKEIK